MGDVLSVIRVMPTGVGVDMNKLKAEIQKLKPYGAVEKPVAFGLKCLEVQFIRPDSEGGTDALEDQMRKIEGVESVDVIAVTLV